MEKFYLTTPIYYVNAKPHIGSAYTTIAADVLARFYKQTGREVFFLTGTAEHGTKMSNSATQAGKKPQDFVDENSLYFRHAWEALHIETTDFLRTTEKRHEQAVLRFFVKLKDSGKIYEGEYDGLYCVGHEAFMKASDLDANGLCPDHKTAPERIKEKNWFFQLSEYAPVLKEKIMTGAFQIEPAIRRNEVLSFIERGLEDISISRPAVEWAIPLPWDPRQTIYVWLDELFSYCSAIGYGTDEQKFKRYWPADLHLVGKDIIKFHCIIWPALLLAIHEPLPKKVFGHGFFTVDGQKMSKTVGNVVDPVAIAKEYSPDVVRYFLLREIPFGADGDFSAERLAERYNADLANGLGNFVSRTLNMIEKFWPEYDGSGHQPDAVQATLQEASRSIEQLAFDKALLALWSVIGWADQLIEQHRPWELAKKGERQLLVDVLQQLFKTLEAVNHSIAPFMPETYEKIDALLKARPIRKPVEPLFARREPYGQV